MGRLQRARLALGKARLFPLVIAFRSFAFAPQRSCGVFFGAAPTAKLPDYRLSDAAPEIAGVERRSQPRGC